MDTAHALITPSMTRETAYVAMTRGRHANTTTDQPDSEGHHDTPAPTGRDLLRQVLVRTGAEPSAHELLQREQDRAGSIAQLAAEYDTIAASAQRPRWTDFIRTSELTPGQAEAVITSEAFGPLCALLRRADAHWLAPERLLPSTIGIGPIDDAHDIAAVLHHRIDTLLTQHLREGRGAEPRLIVGLIPYVDGPMDDEHRAALQQRQHLIEQRARDRARTAPHEARGSPPPTDLPPDNQGSR